MKANQKFRNSDAAVSEVVGVVLLVGITVMIAALVYLYVSGLMGSSISSFEFLQSQRDKLQGEGPMSSGGGSDPGGQEPNPGGETGDPGGSGEGIIINDPSPNGIVPSSVSIYFSVYIGHAKIGYDNPSIYYEIICSNGQSVSDNGVPNGRYGILLTDIVAGTTYLVTVIGVNTENGLSATEQYPITLDIVLSNPPTISNPNPADTATNVPTSLNYQFTLFDPEGDPIDYTFQSESGGEATIMQATGVTNGVQTVSLSNLQALTTYTVTITATDVGGSGQSTIVVYTFTTGAPDADEDAV